MANNDADIALVISELHRVLEAAKAGDCQVHVDVEKLRPSGDQAVTIGKLLNELLRDLNVFQTTSMDIAIGLSECFHVLSEVRSGRLNARVSESGLTASDELIAKFSAALNDTIEEISKQVETITNQRLAIQELSTPILQVWDDVLALPVIGVVDSRRTAEMMEKLLNEVVARQARFVILDITGVEVVDTRTADHFIKVIRSAELLGTKCVVTGIRPAVAQTLVELGIDLSAIITMRDLQAGLKECLRLKSTHHS
ncbi:MAG: STAS domain-containing protein [Deltaproteobacteria bacterium]|nr:STAS domain-containing protein [Deltaproteobacteria bacterium]